MTNALEQVRDLFETVLTIGEPRSSGALTLVPLFGAPRAARYSLAEEAFGAGSLVITEVGPGVVPELLAMNNGDLPVLLLDGEHLLGAMQDRVLNVSVLLAARRQTVLPVSCVEQERWSRANRSDFALAQDMAYARLRAVKLDGVVSAARAGHGRRSDQGAVWRDIAQKHVEVGARSVTGAMLDAYERRRGTLDEVLQAFSRPEPGQVGVVACVGGRPVALDAFDRPETIERLWQRLLSGYAMDAVDGASAPIEPDAVEAFVRSAAEGEVTIHEAVGLGEEVLVTATSVVASALVWEGAVVHAAAFVRFSPA